MVPAFDISPARSTDDFAAVAGLFRAYAASLDVDLAYQDFAGELASLPGQYAPPRGSLLLARGMDGSAIGCVALRPIGHESRCEMKRLYVSPAARGLGLGRALVEAIIREARLIGYCEIRLDSLPGMTAATALYGACGFVEVAPYYDTPVEGTRFFARPLVNGGH